MLQSIFDDFLIFFSEYDNCIRVCPFCYRLSTHSQAFFLQNKRPPAQPLPLPLPLLYGARVIIKQDKTKTHTHTHGRKFFPISLLCARNKTALQYIRA